MLLVAIGDRKARIEVGYGLEPILPDALAGRVLAEQLYPAFKQQRYAQGLTQAVSRIAAIVERGEPAPPEARQGERPWRMGHACFGVNRFRRLRIWRHRSRTQVATSPSCGMGAIFGGVAMFLALLHPDLHFCSWQCLPW